MIDCPSRDRLLRFLQGALDPHEQLRIVAHVESCPLCQPVLEDLADDTGWMDALCLSEGQGVNPFPNFSGTGFTAGGAGVNAGGLGAGGVGIGAGRVRYDGGGDASSSEFVPPPPLRPSNPFWSPRPGADWRSPAVYKIQMSDPDLRGRDSTPKALVPSDPKESTSWPLIPGLELLSRLGEGGMGQVYCARQLGLNRLVAVKTIRTGSQDSKNIASRFQVEVEAVARLRHLNVVEIYDTGAAEGISFYVMELLDGGNLLQYIAGKPCDPGLVARVFSALAHGTHAVHLAGVIHRDIKPANILFDHNGVPKLVDFGLAKLVSQNANHTRIGLALGTPNYMSPEQAEGRMQAVGPLSDVWGLGASLYEMLTGRPPFKGVPPKIFTHILLDDPDPPRRLIPKIPRDLETICLKCLAKSPHRRYASAEALGEDLDRFIAGQPILARPVSLRERSWKWVKRHPSLTLAWCTIAMLLGGATAGLIWWQDVQHERENQYRARYGDHERGILLALHDAESQTRNRPVPWDQVRSAANAAVKRIDQAVVALRSDANAFPIPIPNPPVTLTAPEPNVMQKSAAETGESAGEVFGTDPVTQGVITGRFWEAERRKAEKLVETATEQIRIRDEKAKVLVTLEQFRQYRMSVLVFGTQFRGLGSGDLHGPVENSVRKALSLYAVPGSERNNSWKIAPFSSDLSLEQRQEISAGFWEMLLMLTEASARNEPHTSEQLNVALAVLDRARDHYAAHHELIAPVKPGELKNPDSQPGSESDSESAPNAPKIRVISHPVRSTATAATAAPAQVRARAEVMERVRLLELRGGAANEVKSLKGLLEELPPRHAVDFYACGLLTFHQKRESGYRAAIPLFENAITRQPEHFWSRLLLSISLIQTGRPDKARDHLGQCLTSRNDPLVRLLHGISCVEIAHAYATAAALLTPNRDLLTQDASGLYERAAADYRDVEEYIRTHEGDEWLYPLLVNRGLMAYRQKRWSDAERDFLRAIAIRPQSFQAHLEFAEVARRQGRYEDAAKRLEEAMRQVKERDHAVLAFQHAKILREQFKARKLGDETLPRILADLTRAIDLEPDPTRRAEYFAYRAESLLYAQRPQESLADARSALQLNPNQHDAEIRRVEALLKLKRDAEAIVHCDQYLKKHPPIAPLLQIRGIARAQVQDYPGAITDFTRALDLDPRNAELFILRGWVYLCSNASELAERDFHEAILLNPRDPSAFGGHGNALVRLGRHREGVQDAEKSLEIAPKDHHILYGAARTYAQAADVVAKEVKRNGQTTVREFEEYRQRAWSLLDQALAQLPVDQRDAFQRDKVQSDPALKALRRRS